MNQRPDPAFLSQRLEAALRLREELHAELNATVRCSSGAAARALAVARDRRALIASREALERSRAALSKPVGAAHSAGPRSR